MRARQERHQRGTERRQHETSSPLVVERIRASRCSRPRSRSRRGCGTARHCETKSASRSKTFASRHSLSRIALLRLRQDARPHRNEFRKAIEDDSASSGDEVCQCQRGELALPALRHVVELQPANQRDVRRSGRRKRRTFSIHWFSRITRSSSAEMARRAAVA